MAFVVIAIIAALVFFIYLLLGPEVKAPQKRHPQQYPPFEEPVPIAPPSVQAPLPTAPIKPHVLPAKPLPPSPGATKNIPQSLPQKAMPELAILIDDMGYDQAIDNALLSLDAPVSFAFLPGAPHTKKLAGKAFQLGRDVLVHLPLEPLNPKIDPGPGALRLDMAPDIILATLKKDLDAIPHAIGVNNHMGSRFTADRKAMELIMPEIKRRGLFFVDSKTTGGSVAYSIAREMGVPTAARDIFLDNDQDPAAIKKELRMAILLAKRGRGVIAIGHPFSNTRKVLYEELPLLKKEVRLVPVHAIVRTN